MNHNGKIVAVVGDLFFASKIQQTARQTGVAVTFATTEAAVLSLAAEKPALIIVDLNINSLKPLLLIAQLKSDPELKHISLMGFVSHVQGELKMEGQKAGCDSVLARSQFSQNLAQILKRHSGQMG